MHIACFDVPWTHRAFETLLVLPTTLVLGVFAYSDPQKADSPPSLQAANKNISDQKGIGTFAGFMMVSILSGAEAEILTFCVHPNYRKLGIGNQLMRELISSLIIFKCKNCYLDVAENNIAAIRLYENFGFQITGKRQNYYKNSNGEVLSALLMTIDLEK
jgi:ribosomal protein S18 acetylase RimI-like enzyme